MIVHSAYLKTPFVGMLYSYTFISKEYLEIICKENTKKKSFQAFLPSRRNRKRKLKKKKVEPTKTNLYTYNFQVHTYIAHLFLNIKPNIIQGICSAVKMGWVIASVIME